MALPVTAARAAARKVFAGAQIRRLRRELSLTQAAMAADLDISTSYLNLIERNQRPVSAQLLLRLADVYDLDVKALAGSDEDRLLADLKEVFSDPLFKGSGVGNAEMQDLAMGNPAVAQAMATLYRAYHDALGNAIELAGRLTTDSGGPRPLEPQSEPAEEVRDFVHRNANHFPELETAAERLRDDALAERADLDGSLRAHLEGRLGVSTRIEPIEVMGATLRRYERDSRRLFLSEMLNPSGRTFQMAHQIALSGHRPLLDRLVAAGGFKSVTAAQLCRVALANYFAGAVMMPYEPFRQAAKSLRYDIDVLGQRFGASFEQVCHRLTTMQRPGARGVPFFLLRVDNAGNISKRFSAGGFHFARFGGACPRWNVHDAFQTPGRIVTQIVEMPDGATYFSIARTVRRTGFGSHALDQQLAIGLGCEVAHARKVVYADGYDLERAAQIATPIGPTCRLCEREDCPQRAFPPLTHRLAVNEDLRGLSAFDFTR